MNTKFDFVRMMGFKDSTSTHPEFYESFEDYSDFTRVIQVLSWTHFSNFVFLFMVLTLFCEMTRVFYLYIISLNMAFTALYGLSMSNALSLGKITLFTFSSLINALLVDAFALTFDHSMANSLPMILLVMLIETICALWSCIVWIGVLCIEIVP